MDDHKTEGPEQFTISLVEPVIGVALANTGAVSKQITVNDTSTLTLGISSGPTTMDEGTQATTIFSLNSNPVSPLSLDFTLTNDSTASNDFVSIEYRLDSADSWSTLTSGQVIVVPVNRSQIQIKTAVVADMLTEGDEQFTISLSEHAPGTLLSNSGPVVRQITVTDTSTGPGFPATPLAPTGFSGSESYSFITDPSGDFELNETGGTSSITWNP